MNYKKSLLNQVILQDHYLQTKKDNRQDIITLVLLGAVAGMIGITAFKACTKEPEPVQRPCHDCHTRVMVMANYFKKAGSKTPEQLAVAVLSTKNPRLLAAIAVVETNGNNVKNTGYKKRHQGVYQVNPRHWGVVDSKDIAKQSLQAERILTELTNEMPIKKALSQYGGDSSDKYQRKVLAELVKVP